MLSRGWWRFWDIGKFVPVCFQVQKKTKRLETALPSTLQSGFGPSNCYLFGSLKDHLRGHHYETDEVVQKAVRSWLRGAGTDVYRRGIYKSLQRWQKCIQRDGDFVEK
jgi:hypothetical protein